MTKQIKIYLFGDSICFGQLISPQHTWGVRLASKIELAFQSIPVCVQNPSVNGNTTRQALERMAYDITAHQPDVVLIQFGMNDCNYWQTDNGLSRVSEQSFCANLREMIQRARNAGCKTLFMATNHPSLKGKLSEDSALDYDLNNRRYNQLIREVAIGESDAGREVNLVDNEAYWTAHLQDNPQTTLDSLLLPDGIHLSAAGHDLYLQTSGAQIVRALQKVYL